VYASALECQQSDIIQKQQVFSPSEEGYEFMKLIAQVICFLLGVKF
jgi:hypothetical protein